MMMASSSSSSLARTWLYHVFLSFRGPDVRKRFLRHVEKELKSKGIIVFIDDQIRPGQSITPELVRAIRQSRVSLVLLSPNYASSSWCLDELVEIMKCKKEDQQTVLTIYYEVDPSDVRNQTGDFGKAFDETCVGKLEEVKQAWRQALNDVAGIIGYHSRKCDNEAELINKVASDVVTVLGFTPSKDFDDFVGIRARITEIKSKLIFQSEKVKVIGIFGPAGIGKTTTARVFYNQLSPYFQFNTFLENIRGSYEKPCGNDYRLKLLLQKNLLSQIFNKGDIQVHHLRGAQEMLSDKKVLVVFDEVDNWWQLEEMAKQPGWVGPGSIIIITTEDRKLLKALKLGSDHIYQMKYPTKDESLQIFCQYAFGQKYPDDGFESLATEVTWLAGDLPLGLRVMGSYLRGMSRAEWIEALPWLRSTLDREIESTLRFSYDALRDNEKTIFLHIACFFTGYEVDKFKMYFENSSLEVNHGLEVLAQKSLIYIEYKCLKMHRLLEQMGREIVKKESMVNPATPLFLTGTKEISDALDEDNATGNFIGIRLSLSAKIQIKKSAFQGMNNLQFLCSSFSTIHTPEGLDCLPDKLISLSWNYCRLRVWPSKFSAKFLVELFLQYSKFEMLWEGIKPLPCLKEMNLLSSRNLKKIPDLSEATSLEELYLGECSSLLEITSSIGNATKLYRLDIAGCTKIKDFPNVPDSIVELDCCRTGIKEVPPWIGNLFRLRKLKMYRCKKLKTISPNISKLENLELLGLSNSDYHPYTDRYEDDPRVDMCDDAFEATIEWGDGFKRSWKLLSDFNVHYILPRCLPKKALTSPISLRLSNMIGIKTIPDCIRRLSGLIKFDVRECIELVALPPVPDSLLRLNAQGCEFLKRIDSSFQNPNIRLNFAKCFSLKQKARRLIQTSACKYAVLPGEEVPAHFTQRASSDSLTINLAPRPLSSSFRFKACILLSNAYDHPEDNNDDDTKEGKNSFWGMSYSVRAIQNGLTVGGGSNQINMPDLYRPCQFSQNRDRPPLREYREHLYIFEDSFTLNKDCPEAEETNFSEFTFVFRVHQRYWDDSVPLKSWTVKGCGIRLLQANNESVSGEAENGEDDEEEDEDSGGDDDDDDDESGDSDNNKVGENDYPHSSDSLFNQSSPFRRGTPSSGGHIRHPSAFPQYSSLPPRTSTVQTFGYNQGGPSIDPQSGTGMTFYPPPTFMQSGYSRPFYGNPMHQGGDKQQQTMFPVPQSLNPHSIPQQHPSMQLSQLQRPMMSQLQRPMQFSQLQRPMQPLQHVRPPMHISQPSEQGVSLQNQYQIPLHPMQQRQFQPYYHPPQQQQISQVHQQPVQDQQGVSLQNQYQIPLHPIQMMQQIKVQPYYHSPRLQDLSHVQQQAVQGQQGAGPSQRQESCFSKPFCGNLMHQGGDKQQNMLPVPQSLNPHSITQQMPSMQLQRPMQPPQYVRPSMQNISQLSEQGVPLQRQYQIPLHPMQMMQQTQVQPYYHVSDVQQHQPQQQTGSSQRKESGMSLPDYLQSPETIQALLSNREKQMQMLQEKLGQL